MSDEAEATEETSQQQEPIEAPEQTDPLAFTPEQQKKVNDLLAKERATATRKANQKAKAKMTQPKPQEPTTEAEHVPDPRIDLLMEKFEQLTDTIASDKSTNDFKAETAGLELDETQQKLMKLAHASDPDLFAKMVADERAKDTPPAPKGNGVNGLPAPGAPPAADRLGPPHTWSKDVIATKKQNGTFLRDVKAYRASMPGSGGGLFPAKSPGKGAA